MTGKRDLRSTFDDAAASYQSARPPYPGELFDDLVSLTNLRPRADLLEIGCGPGTATLPMARRGYHITALEPGPNLAHQARRNLAAFPNVQVVTTTFEDWRPQQTVQFDLLYAASAWHWIDTSVGWPKAAELLKHGGHLAIFGAYHALPTGYDPIFNDIQQLYDKLGEGNLDRWPPPPPPTDNKLPEGDYAGAGYFALEAVRRYLWSQQYTADTYIALLNTFSGHIAMEPDKREHLYTGIRRLLAARPKGELTRHWSSTLSIARRLPTPHPTDAAQPTKH